MLSPSQFVVQRRSRRSLNRSSKIIRPIASRCFPTRVLCQLIPSVSSIAPLCDAIYTDTVSSRTECHHYHSFDPTVLGASMHRPSLMFVARSVVGAGQVKVSGRNLRKVGDAQPWFSVRLSLSRPRASLGLLRGSVRPQG